MRIDLPQNVNFIIDTLYEHGFEAYAVGGCVRDSLLGRTPQDWDITTSAKPAQVKAIFDHTIDTGIQHGTVTVMLEHVGYEVTTYRIWIFHIPMSWQNVWKPTGVIRSWDIGRQDQKQSF